MNLNPVYCINTKEDFGLTALIESSQFMKNEYEKNQGDIVENQNTESRALTYGSFVAILVGIITVSYKVMAVITNSSDGATCISRPEKRLRHCRFKI